MLKNYEYRGKQFQFEEGKQPEGAVEIKARKVANKSKTATSNKASSGEIKE